MENTKIEWTATYLPDGTILSGYTHNEWIGCNKVSAGCKNCYAETLMDTRWGKVEWGVNGTRVRTTEVNRKKPFKWDKEAEKSGIRRKVFCSSLSDIFEDREELIEWRFGLFETIKNTPNLDWLILTKRPENAYAFFQDNPELLFDNIWMGTSVENKEQANIRIPELLQINAKIRFLSCEPLLGEISLTEYYKEEGAGTYSLWIDYIDWVIVGGESGHNARPMHPDWARNIQKQCEIHETAFFFKQNGEYLAATDKECQDLMEEGLIHKYTPSSQFSRETMKNILNSDMPFSGFWKFGDTIFAYCNDEENPRNVLKLGKKNSGALLDGKEYKEFPI